MASWEGQVDCRQSGCYFVVYANVAQQYYDKHISIYMHKRCSSAEVPPTKRMSCTGVSMDIDNHTKLIAHQ